LQTSYATFKNIGAEIVAMAVAPLASVDGARQIVQAAFPMLADPNYQAAEAYGVYNVLGDGFAAPSVFIIDTDGSIVWSHIGRGPNDRPSAQKIFEELQRLMNS
jgi:peroxiredoxin